MFKKGVLVALLFFLFIGTFEAYARSVVVPTAYGYSVVHDAWRPYYSPTRRSRDRRARYYYAGNYPWGPAQLPYMYWGAVPAWNGAYWYYSSGYSLAATSADLNVRSEPRVPKNRRANVIGTLRAGEQVYILGSSGRWYYVQSVYAPMRRGYVYGSYLYSGFAAATPVGYYAWAW